MTEIICSGFGGQGVLVAGMILADAGMEDGKNVTFYPTYGAAMRGGSASCNVVISEEEIASPFCKKADIVLTMNETAIDEYEGKLRPGGLLLVNSSIADPDRSYREDVRVVKVAATELAAELGNSRGANIVMLGALAQASGDFDAEYLCGAVDTFFAKKGKTNPKNALCFRRGMEAAAKQED